jgi:GT2 family glycosyltransferase
MIKPLPSTVTVIICAYTEDRWDDLCDAVRSVDDQRPSAAQLLVVIDHNDALLRRAAEEFVTAMVTPNRFAKGLSGARNTGVADATGAIVAFLDDDATARPGWLAALTSPFSDPAVMGVGGRVQPAWSGEAPPWLPESFWWVIGCSYEGLPTVPAPIRNPIGANMAFRREVLAEVGGFSESLGRVGQNPLGCEETELSIRASQHWPDRRHVYAPSAVVDHRVPASRGRWSYFVRRCYSEGLSKSRVSALVGHGDGLRAERAHALGVLPRTVARSVRKAGREGRIAPLGQVGAVAAGVTAIGAGLVRGRLSQTREPTVVASSTGPTCVVDFHVGRAFPPVPSQTPSGEPYRQAVVLARVGTRPAGTVTVDLGPAATSVELEAAVRQALGPAITRLEAAAELTMTPTLEAAS